MLLLRVPSLFNMYSLFPTCPFSLLVVNAPTEKTPDARNFSLSVSAVGAFEPGDSLLFKLHQPLNLGYFTMCTLVGCLALTIYVCCISGLGIQDSNSAAQLAAPNIPLRYLLHTSKDEATRAAGQRGVG